jgi:hypothetical protein
VKARQRQAPTQASLPLTQRRRVFDHLTGHDEDQRFIEAAQAMKRSPSWTFVELGYKPADSRSVAGEIPRPADDWGLDG